MATTKRWQTIAAIAILVLLCSLSYEDISIQPAKAAAAAPDTQWRQQLGNRDTELISNIIQTSDGGYAFIDLGWSHGYTLTPSTIYKVNSSGNLTWQNTIKSFIASSFIQTNDEGFELWGKWDTYGTTYQNTPALIKIDSAGNIQWTQNITVVNPDSREIIHKLMLADGTSVLQYQTSGVEQGQRINLVSLTKMNSSGKVDWNQTYTFNGNRTYVHSLMQTSDGGYALLGATSFDGIKDTPNTYYWPAKTDSQGNLQFNRQYGNGPPTLNTNTTENEGAQKGYATYGFNIRVFGDNEPKSITETADGGLIIAGITYPEGHYTRWDSFTLSHTYIVKSDSKGITQWSKVFNGSENSPVIQTSDSGFAFATPGSIIKTDFNGQTQWAINVTYTYPDYPGSIFLSNYHILLKTQTAPL
ncbi:MAG TPA: hypothetical protein VK253_00260 [Candidatus Binatia bacterium]|nr:hypothetical protein [Candidatus Binatia bacterium]